MKIFSEYGFEEAEVKEKVIFLSDRGPNIKYGLIHAGFIRLNCYAHLIHNLVSHMLTEETVKATISACAKLSAYFKNTGLNNRLHTTLKLYSTTRWNSVFTMFDAIANQYQAIYDLLVFKQRIVNEDRLKRGKRPENTIVDLITVISHHDLTKIRDFLEQFKVCN